MKMIPVIVILASGQGSKSRPISRRTVRASRTVLPKRPPHTEGWSEEQLVDVVARDSLTGVSRL